MAQIVWPFRQALRAACLQQHAPHEAKAPDDDCSCGIYGFRDRDDAEQSHERYITGRVALWGEFVEHALGWRAEFAYPLELWIPDAHWEQAVALMETYSVAVHLKDVSPVRLAAATHAELPTPDSRWTLATDLPE